MSAKCDEFCFYCGEKVVTLYVDEEETEIVHADTRRVECHADHLKPIEGGDSDVNS